METRNSVRVTLRGKKGYIDRIPVSNEFLSTKLIKYLKKEDILNPSGIFLEHFVRTGKKLEDINNDNFHEIIDGFKGYLIEKGYSSSAVNHYSNTAQNLIWLFRASRERLPLSFGRFSIPRKFLPPDVEEMVRANREGMKPFVRFMLDSELTPATVTEKDLTRYKRLLTLKPCTPQHVERAVKSAQRLIQKATVKNSKETASACTRQETIGGHKRDNH